MQVKTFSGATYETFGHKYIRWVFWLRTLCPVMAAVWLALAIVWALNGFEWLAFVYTLLAGQYAIFAKYFWSNFRLINYDR